MAALELRVLPLSELKPAPYHPRLALTSPARKRLRASLAEFGPVEPLVWNEHTGHVVGGRARLGLLAELGHSEVPVSVVRLSDAREKALNLVLNNAKAQGRHDAKKLEPLLHELAELPEFALTGFDRRILSAFRMEPVRGAIPEPRSDRVEITFVANAATFAALAPALDRLIGDHALVAHVRHGA
jgi:ParB-like chromosome segregation protein Spo0J